MMRLLPRASPFFIPCCVQSLNQLRRLLTRTFLSSSEKQSENYPAGHHEKDE